jgi:hypothetical protein
VAALHGESVAATRLAAITHDRADGPDRVTELVRLLEDHRSAGSELAERLLDTGELAATFWVVEPVAPAVIDAATVATVAARAATAAPTTSTVPTAAAFDADPATRDPRQPLA